MNAVGIDVSKGRSTVAVARPFGETVVKPFEVLHTKSGIENLVNMLNALEGECRVVMEHTGRYYEPMANWLSGAGLFVSAVNPWLIKDFSINSLRKALFQVMDVLIKTCPQNDPVYAFMDKKRREGKPYYVYMTAGANKFLRIYYGCLKAHLDNSDT